ncbi:MAG: M20/M25/M40 family metallo-hydrolase [Kiritimatiellae bacterium]|nr:M20/M25/M40 family metallo-hydrolase [Kiritimatiellia bacterium]
MVSSEIDTGFAGVYFERNRERILADYFTLIRFPTVGADSKHLGDCAKAAAWLKQFLKPMGFSCELLTPATGLPVPVLFAERPGRPGSSTVLFYGHYDVQPEDPVDEWKTPPFEPTLIDNRVYARGAQDDKGQFFSFLYGLRALVEAGEDLPTIKILLEGQEESGSGAIAALLPELAPRIAADVLLVADTHSAPDFRPAIIAGMRGVQHFMVKLTGPSKDVHSGMHGGLAPNPALGIARLLASMFNPDGSVAVEGFRDGIAPPTEEEVCYATESTFDPEQYEIEVGCPPVGGTEGLPMVMRGSFEPTLEVNGIHGGYGGPGSKTVIPSSAFAKLSVRLVPDQSPAHVFNAIKARLESHCPKGMKLEILEVFEGLPGFRLPIHSPVFRLAADALAKLDQRGPVFVWEGASIPIVSRLKQVSGAAPLLVGFGRECDNIHSPNESFGLDQFLDSMMWATLILKALV